jgi:hypothetical protein
MGSGWCTRLKHVLHTTQQLVQPRRCGGGLGGTGRGSLSIGTCVREKQQALALAWPARYSTLGFPPRLGQAGLAKGALQAMLCCARCPSPVKPGTRGSKKMLCAEGATPSAPSWRCSERSHSSLGRGEEMSQCSCGV